MSSVWTFTTDPDAGGTVTAVMGPPERNDAYQRVRRQAVATSDGGDVFVQDLGVEDEFLNLRWENAKPSEWSGLDRVLRAANWRSRRIQISVTGDKAFPVGIGPSQTVDGLALSPGQGHSPGDTVLATAFTLSVKLDQSQSEWEHQQEAKGSIALRFRTVPNGS